MTWSTKKLGKAILVIIFIIFGFLFLTKGQYWYSFFSLLLVVILIRIEDLTKMILNKGDFKLELAFEKDLKKKIENEIQDNKEEITQDKIKFYKDLETTIIEKIHKKLGGELKIGIKFVYGTLEKPEFVFIPDAVIRTKDEMVFIEIKHIIRPEFAKKIIETGIRNLKLILEKFKPSAGTKLKAKLIVASTTKLDISNIVVSDNIDIEFFNL